MLYCKGGICMSTIELYDSKNLEGKLLIWNYGNNYETFIVTNSHYHDGTMSVAGYDLLFSRRQFWFNKLREDIPRLYIVKKEF